MIHSKQITSNSEATEHNVIYYNTTTKQTLFKQKDKDIETVYYSVMYSDTPIIDWNETSAPINFHVMKTTYHSDPSIDTEYEELIFTETVSVPQNGGEYNPVDLSNPNTEYVDLGLPSGLKWAKCNLGAQTETEFGPYFAWAETQGYANGNDKHSESQERLINDSFQWSGMTVNYTVKQLGTMGGFLFISTPYYSGKTYTDYRTDAYPPATTLALTDDAAHVNMGGNWRMPTQEEFQELLDNTTQIWYDEGNTEFNGVGGVKCVSNQDTSKYIFIPGSGLIDGTYTYSTNNVAFLWASTLFSDYYAFGYYLTFGNSFHSVTPTNRYKGFNIRGVLE